MFGLMTNIILEVSTTAIWWVIKKTTKGIYYILWETKEGKRKRYEIGELESEVKRLEEKIEILENYIESLKKN